MATLSAVGAAGKVTLAGTGYSAGQRVVVSVGFSATGRRYNEIRAFVADGVGAIISTDVTVPYAGAVVAAAVNTATGAVDATTGTATVT